ncbi:MAG: OmpA family protein [Bdellovibrionales bacterium]
MNAKILLAGAALALLPVSAHADYVDYDGFYLGAFGGYNYLNGNESTPYTGSTVVGVTSEIEYEGGFAAGAAAGYSWGTGLRTELEYAYRANDVSDVDPNVPGADSGEVTLHTVMVNALYDLPVDWMLRPYGGLGVGFAMASYENIADLGGFTIDDDGTGLAWQVIGGLSYAISPRFSANLEYRWVGTDEFELDTDFAGTQSDLGYASHNALLALRYQFGEPVQRMAPPAPAPMPVAQPAPPPPPPPAPLPAPRVAPIPVVPQTYIVFFDFDKTVITPEAHRVLERAAADIRVGQGVRIHVIGHADRAGSAKYNERLSERRATVVRNELMTLGVADDQIVSRGMGETQNRVPTADGVREAQNRRAEIIFQ